MYKLKNFFYPDLPNECHHTYKRHLAFVVVDAMAAGILANAPVMAIKGMGSPDWQMALQLSISSIGMFLMLYLGGKMAVSRKMPFVMIPGLAYAATTFLMALTDNVLLFILLLGVGMLFEVITRPAVTAIIRLNYPATHRGVATGEVRKWYSLVFLCTSLLSAFVLDLVETAPTAMIKGQMILASVLSVTAFFVFKTIKVKETHHKIKAAPKQKIIEPFVESLKIIKRDKRFQRYLAYGFIYAFGGLTYVSFVPVFLVNDLKYSYVSCSMLTHIFPSLLTFLTTGAIGAWIDRINPWKAWGFIRLGWGLDPLILALSALLFPVWGSLALVLPVVARVSRGLVMGGSWILWWQVGINHFAPPGGDTTRYMGIIIFMNGLTRLLAPVTGAYLLHSLNIFGVFVLGGSMVLLSSLLCFVEYQREKKQQNLETMEKFEKSFEG